MDSKAWAFLRSYILDYVVGVLWLLAACVAFLNMPRLNTMLAFINEIRLKHPIQVADFAVGFITVLSGVVVPYCISMLVMPTARLVVDALFLLQSMLWRRNVKRDHKLERMVSAIWEPQTRSAGPLSNRTKIMLLRAKNVDAADDLSGHLDELVFRSNVFLPTSLLLYAITWRLTEHAEVAAVITAAVFLIGAITVNTNANTWLRRLNIAMLALGVTNAVGDEINSNRYRDAAGGLWLNPD